ncbi:Strictosidine synthase [Morella rubra]|uniref:Strictosidine synthase n=1 Tax=Morella rubra TaxID=262757 RepID=A0A6A1VM40_9ROSI|nr:Strictosidine synthase [Morella rubra]
MRLPFPSSALFFLLYFSVTPGLIFSYEPTSTDHLRNYRQLDLPPGVFGPESIAFDCHGNGPYVGVSDGRILEWHGARLGWVWYFCISQKDLYASNYKFAPFAGNGLPPKNSISTVHPDPSHKIPFGGNSFPHLPTARFSFTNIVHPLCGNRQLCDGSTNPNSTEQVCGRPLGLKFNPATCDLYIADAYFGLLMVGHRGGVAKQLATSAEGVPFRFTNALDVDDKTGVVYFTDSSILFQRRAWLRILLDGDRTGRLMKYDPQTKRVTVLLKGLAFPNGVALSKDSSFLVLSESGTYQVLRFWLEGPKSHTSEIFCQLERSPDNIKRNSDGKFWLALNSGRDIPNLDYNLDLQHEVAIPRLTNDPVAAKLDEEGKVVSILDGKGGNALDSVSEVEEHSGMLWIGSAVKPYVGVIKKFRG